MRWGVVKSVGAAATVTSRGYTSGAASGQPFEVKPTRNHQTESARRHQSGVEDAPVSRLRVDNVDSRLNPSRNLHVVLDDDGPTTNNSDDAMDVSGSPEERAERALVNRQAWAVREFEASQGTFHFNNGDRSSEASFHKTLPHDHLGQVDEDAFNALIACISEGSFDTCEEVSAGDAAGFLVQPIGGIAVDMAGPAGSANTAPSAPLLNSEDLAAQLAEVYWMALTRDVPFSRYGEHEDTIAAADNLATMPGFAKMNGVAVDSEGRADPQTQLFRSTAYGVQTGPFVSQLLVKDFTMDSLTVTPRQRTFAPGIDYMTDYNDWLHIQNGGAPDSAEEEDDEERYIRNARDLARLVVTDTIFTEAFRGALILLEEGAISGGNNGPYLHSSRQRGFVSFGASHLMKILGTAEMAQRSSWYQKWNVHLFARPEAVAGTLHNVLYGNLDVEFDASLLDNDELLDRVASANAATNGRRGPRGKTYMLSQAVSEGSPAHPSYPAGHAVQNGAYATILKAFVGIERAHECFSDPVYPDDDGLNLLPYDGECLTYEGEINKLAVNVAFGRQMCGVHYRFDSEEGLILGEIVAVRLLQQEALGFPENAGYEFNLMSGERMRIEPDGSFFVDDRLCEGDAFQGVHLC